MDASFEGKHTEDGLTESPPCRARQQAASQGMSKLLHQDVECDWTVTRVQR